MKARLAAENAEERLLRFYTMAAVVAICGLTRSSADRCEELCGAPFMTQVHAADLMLAVRRIMSLGSTGPRATFWGYMAARGAQLELPVQDPAQLALARLACLTRTRPDNTW